ncbi:MAG: HPr family phosphocarrier protein [Candidatus Omnitrophica bacterium]|nr:HPr family phosphocarrier protein [Candidatus Omnitrophota bacterium]
MVESKKEKSYSKHFVIRNKLGLHARPAALFVQTANRFESDIRVYKGRQKVDGKSIMGIMTLAAGNGSSITVHAAGKDARQAIDAFIKLFATNFGEEEGKGS